MGSPLVVVVVTIVCVLLPCSRGNHLYYICQDESGTCPQFADAGDCNTLSYYATAANGNYFASGNTFILLPGIHWLNSSLVIRDVDSLTMTAEVNSGVNILCSQQAGISFINVSSLTLNGFSMTQCGTVITPSFFNDTVTAHGKTFLSFTVDLRAAIFMSFITDLILTNVTVSDSFGYGLLGVNLLGDTLISQNYFLNNNHRTLDDSNCYTNPSFMCKGGGMVILYTDLQECPDVIPQYFLSIERSVFQGGVDSGVTYQPFTEPIFANDVQLIGGAGLGLLLMQSSYGLSVNITDCNVSQNAAYVGANVYMIMWDYVDNSAIIITNTSMSSANTFQQFIDILEMAGRFTMAPGYFFMYGMIPLVGTYSPVCVANERFTVEVLRVEDSEVSYNQATLNSGGFMYLWPRSFFRIPRHITLNRLKASGNNGDATFINFHFVDPRFGQNFKVFYTDCFFSDNYYRKYSNGLETSSPQVNLINSAQYIEFTGCKWINNLVSGVRSLQSILYFTGSNEFIGNSAQNGGGLNVREGSTVYWEPNSVTKFENNQATQFGGAIYADMVSYKCFYQLSDLQSLPRVIFINNKAVQAGDAVYANTDNCILQAGVYVSDAFQYFSDISDFSLDAINSTSLISAPATEFCICENGTVNCSGSNIIPVQVSPGQTFRLSLEARASSYIDDELRSLFGIGLTPTEVIATVTGNSTEATIGSLQSVQTLLKGCSELEYNLYSRESQHLQVFLAPQNLRLYTPVILNVTLVPCPNGFVESSLRCVCNPLLSENGITCQSDTLTITREPDTWIGTINISSNNTLVAVASNCFIEEYCNTSKITDLTLANTDVQCLNHRSGVVCGQCQPGYSIILGSSKCLKCSNGYLSLLILFAVAGFFLIGVLSLFNITVATGRINSMLFYANVIKLTNFEFFTLDNHAFAIFQIIIDWINLDFGIESCFYDGLNFYTKAWLQFLFPLYLYILLIVPIVAARYSSRISKVLPRNMLPVMTTVVLITFTKLLRATVLSIAFQRIDTEQGLYVMWAHDANILYASVKHVMFMLFCIFVYIVFLLPFALTIFFYPFIWSFSSHEGTKFEMVVCFIRTRLFKMKPILETFDGPYMPNSRYWTGLLIILRMVIYFFALSIFSEANGEVVKTAGVTALSIVLLGLVIAKKIYYCHINRKIEFAYLLNLVVSQFILLVLSLSNQTLYAQGIVISISIALACLTFGYSVAYENYYRLKPYYYKLRGKSFVDTHKTQCDVLVRERERDTDKNLKLDAETIDQNKFFDVLDARKSATRSSVSYVRPVENKMEQLSETLMN